MASVIKIEMYLHYETERAVLMSTDNNRDSAVWLPKSQIRFDGQLVNAHDAAIGDVVTVHIPEWLADAKGL